jgi:hypothetical protein
MARLSSSRSWTSCFKRRCYCLSGEQPSHDVPRQRPRRHTEIGTRSSGEQRRRGVRRIADTEQGGEYQRTDHRYDGHDHRATLASRQKASTGKPSPMIRGRGLSDAPPEGPIILWSLELVVAMEQDDATGTSCFAIDEGLSLRFPGS